MKTATPYSNGVLICSVTVLTLLSGACRDTISTGSGLPGNSYSVSSPSSSTVLNSTSNGNIAMGPNANAVVNLGQTITVPITITPQGSYRGNVSVTTFADELAAADPSGFVKISLDQASVSLAQGMPVQVNASISVDTQAPSFLPGSGMHFHVQGVDDTGAQLEIEVPLTVNAVYEIHLKGPAGAVETFMDLSGNVILGGSTTYIRHHAEGVQLKYVNYDENSQHIIHGDGGVIVHQNTTMPLAVATASGPGGIYMPPAIGAYTGNVPGNPLTGLYYCHSHENSNQGRKITFNYGADQAHFSQIMANIIRPSCLNCHNGAGGAGGVDLSSYNAIINGITVNAGNPNQSGLYNAVANNSMPTSGGPLTQYQKMAIYDWIASGALNN